MQKIIVCYGDSNSWGYVPGTLDIERQYRERYPKDIRWTGRLQQRLGNHYCVIEEGLCGRTTNLDNPPKMSRGNRNGKTQLEPCLFSQAPLNLVVLFLGINDLKACFNRSAADITEGLEDLIQTTQALKYGPDTQSPPKILIIGFPIVREVESLQGMFKGAEAKSKQLPALFEQVAKRYACDYLNVADQTEFSAIDGCHFDADNHRKFAQLVADKILALHL